MLSGALYKATPVHPAFSESVGIRSFEITIGDNGKYLLLQLLHCHYEH